jgi:CBS domain containing-hemolysin-like protein
VAPAEIVNLQPALANSIVNPQSPIFNTLRAVMSPAVWVGVAILILTNALYVAAEFGAVGVRRSRVRRMSDDGHALATRLLPFVENPVALDRYVGASQVGITVSSLMLGAYGQATLTPALAPAIAASFALEPAAAQSSAALLVLAALTAGQVVLGELMPKALALQYPTETALATVVPMQWSLRVFRPIIAALNGTATLVLRLFGARADRHRHLHSPEEIDLLIAESRDGGLLEPDEQQRLRRALRLGLRTARDLMVPLDRLTTVGIDAAWEDVVRTVAASPFSRLPVYRGTPDRIVGTLRVKDLLERYVSEGPLPLDRLIRPIVQIAGDVPADRVVSLLRERRAHHAVVVDAAGRTLGVLTIQDVLSELIGPRAAEPAARG